MIFELTALFFVLIYVTWKLSTLAGRLDILHRRKDLMRESLEIQLAWREHIFTEMLQSGDLPIEHQTMAARVLLNIDRGWQQSPLEYFAAESDLTNLLIDIFQSPTVLDSFRANPNALQRLTELAAACRKVALARRFHNDAVGALQLLRVRASVRWFRLHGYAEWPRPIDMADSIPGSLEQLR
ncbi:MAG: hypothetical protein RL038_931 [Actinomycetota bacterium]|jgi:hypothetical protein